MNRNHYKLEIEKIAKLTEEEEKELKTLREDFNEKYKKQLKSNLKNIGNTYLGGGALVGGATLLDKSVRDGGLTGIVKRYHNAANENIKSIKDNGLKASYAKNPNFNILTANGAGLQEKDIDNLVYLAKKKRTAAKAGMARYKVKKNIIYDFNPKKTYKDSLKNNTTLNVNIPYSEYKKMNIVKNPELRNSTNWKEFKDKAIKDGVKINEEQAKEVFKGAGKGTDVIKGDIASKFIKGGKGYKRQTLKGLGKHIKENPGAFAKGLGMAGVGGIGVGAGGYLAAKSMINNIKEGKKFKKEQKNDIERINELSVKKWSK